MPPVDEIIIIENVFTVIRTIGESEFLYQNKVKETTLENKM